jgi:hypothetical protein
MAYSVRSICRTRSKTIFQHRRGLVADVCDPVGRSKYGVTFNIPSFGVCGMREINPTLEMENSRS